MWIIEYKGIDSWLTVRNVHDRIFTYKTKEEAERIVKQGWRFGGRKIRIREIKS